MARYRKIDPRIWNDERFRRLSNDGKLAFLFVLTHPHMTAVGAMRATVAGLSAELGVQAKAFREAFREGLLEEFPEACFIGAPKFIRYNPPESPNVVKAWAGAWDLIPECDLKASLFQRLKAFAEGLGEGFREAFREAMPESGAGAGAGAGGGVGEEEPLPLPENSGGTSDQELPPIPASLDVPEFRAAWEEWLAYRRKTRRTVSAIAAKQQFGKLERAGVEIAIAAIEQSISNDWQGLFPEKVKRQDAPKLTPYERELQAQSEAYARAQRGESW